MSQAIQELHATAAVPARVAPKRSQRAMLLLASAAVTLTLAGVVGATLALQIAF